MMAKSTTLDFIISQRDEIEYAKVKSRMQIAIKIADALKGQGLTQKDLATLLGKKPSEISRWLTGTHNFTHDTLFEIQSVLKIKLVNTEQRKAKSTTPIQQLRKQSTFANAH